MGIGDIIAEKKKDLDAWMKKQSTPVEVAAYSAGSAVQGAPTTGVECGDHTTEPNSFFLLSVSFSSSLFNRAGIERALTTLSRVYLLSAFQVVCSATCSGR